MADEAGAVVINMPFSRRLPTTSATSKNLGFTELSKQIDPTGKNARGHWCSRCQGIWYSSIIEAACPVCGNRHG